MVRMLRLLIVGACFGLSGVALAQRAPMPAEESVAAIMRAVESQAERPRVVWWAPTSAGCSQVAEPEQHARRLSDMYRASGVNAHMRAVVTDSGPVEANGRVIGRWATIAELSGNRVLAERVMSTDREMCLQEVFRARLGGRLPRELR